MGFLIKATFWFSLVLLALPLGTGSDNADQPSIGPLQALAAARDAVGDIAGICDRKPDVCATGKEAMHTIAVRAKATVRMASDMMGDDTELPDQTSVTGNLPQKVDVVPTKADTTPARN